MTVGPARGGLIASKLRTTLPCGETKRKGTLMSAMRRVEKRSPTYYNDARPACEYSAITKCGRSKASAKEKWTRKSIRNHELSDGTMSSFGTSEESRLLRCSTRIPYELRMSKYNGPDVDHRGCKRIDLGTSFEGIDGVGLDQW